MNKDYIIVEKEDGSFEKMEVVATIKLEKTSKDFIIYKNLDLDDEHYYAAKYDSSSNLDTNLSEDEQNELNEVFKNIMKGRDKDNA